MTATSCKLSNAFRTQHGLPRLGQRGADPYSAFAPESMCKKMCDREPDVLDVAHLYVKAKMGHLPAHFAVDVSQAPNRRPWLCDGRIPSLHSRSIVWYNNSIIGVRTAFCIMGWPKPELRIPKALNEKACRELVGNMISIPLVGAAVLALAKVAPIGTVKLGRRRWKLLSAAPQSVPPQVEAIGSAP